MCSAMDELTRLAVSVDKSVLYIGMFILSLTIIYLTFFFLGGTLTRASLIDSIAATITTLSLIVTFVLALMAINIFSTTKEIEKIKIESKELHFYIKEHAANVERILCILPFVIESIAERLPQSTGAGSDARDLVYFRLTHGRLLLKLLMTADRKEQVDICRDIIGSMREHDSREILQMTVDTLRNLRESLPGERDLIDPILKKGVIILGRMTDASLYNAL